MMKKWAYLLAVLNFLDGAATYAGMKVDLIHEANPTLSSMPPGTILFLKTILSLALFYLIKKVNLAQPVFRLIIIVGNSLYSSIVAMHLYWMSLIWAS
ncbi:DUF5658 family protein [Bacillus sp. FJAT-27445]|uniref:DUF5658 family protein n=1 Tax=Bacillus sp. FJAT-27445 TaxID=1679166 RepID=UPI000743A6AB|nr:DUF5658 family protein [Bacillus sp. FJAT-27445]